MTYGRRIGTCILGALLFGVAPSCDDDGAAPSQVDDGGREAGLGPDASKPPSKPDASKHDSGRVTPVPEAGTDAGALDLFAAWREARAALRQSPDHLPGRAEALVKGKDPAKLFEFVRDEIVTYPPSIDGFEGALGAMRWGVRGTLRGGAGTPREKAELLADLYHQAGLKAEIVHGAADPAKLDGKRVLLRALTRSYAPALTKAEGDRLRAALGHDAPPDLTVIDSDGKLASALAKSLLALLPSGLTAPFDFTLGDIPLVRVQVSGTWQYANPIAPDAAFGDPVTKAAPLPTGGADTPIPLLVRLEAVRANAPFEKFTLVEHQYDVEDVVGRRIHIGFAPPVDPVALAATTPRNVEAVVPIISVAAPEMTQTERDQLGVAGKPVSFGGDVYDLDGSGNVTLNGAAFPTPTTDPKAPSKVATVHAKANGGAFPRVTLRFQALDSSGGGVQKLPASAITVSEGSHDVSFTVTQNQAPPPRIVLLFDTSTSLPAAFRGAGAVATGNQIVTALYAKYPEAAVRVGTINFGVSWMTDSWATTLADAQGQVQKLATAAGSSEIWQALHDADAEGPTLVVIVTDGDATDQPEPQFTNAIASGPPVLSLGAGTVVQKTLDDVSKLSSGRSVPVTQQAEAVSAVLGEIDARAIEDYVITYTAPKEGGTPAADGGTERTVTVTINGKKYTATYDVPETPAVPPALAGIYLTIRVGSREATRALAGLESGFTTGPVAITPAVLEDVRALLFGRVSIAVEGASPTASVVLDDWIAEKLELEPLWNAATAHDDDMTREALKAGFSITPPKLPLSQPPLRDAISADALTFETAPRIAAMIQKAHDGGPFTRQLDLFPLTQCATAAHAARPAFTGTRTARAGLAVAEAGLLEGTSTLESLSGVALSSLDAGLARDQAGLTDDQMLKWAALEEPFNASYQLVVPKKPGAFWAVDEKTGTVIGILPDGSGGGAEDACSTYDLANSYLQLAGLLGSAFGVSVGGWVALAQWEVKYVTIATIVISGGTPTGSTDLTNPAIDMGCGMLDDAVGDHVPGVGTYESIVGTTETAGGVDTGAPTICGGGMGPCG